MKILALDLGKYKTVGCDYERESGKHRFRGSCTTPAALELLVTEGQLLPRGAKCWTQLGVARLEAMAKPLNQVGMNELWRGQLHMELRQLREVQEEIAVAEEKLDAIAAADPRVALLRTIP